MSLQNCSFDFLASHILQASVCSTHSKKYVLFLHTLLHLQKSGNSVFQSEGAL